MGLKRREGAPRTSQGGPVSNTRKAAIAVAASAMLALTACSSSATPAPGGTTDEVKLVDRTPAATEGLDRLVWNLPYGEPYSLDPAFSSSDSNSAIVANVCESILRPEPDMTFTPNLGDVEEVDPTTYRITMRDDIVFSDGSPVTTDDVLFSMKRYLDPALASSWSAAYTSVASIDATGDREVTVKLTEPDGLFVRMLGLPSAAIVQASSATAAGAAFGSPDALPVCTGPYVFESWNKGENVVIQKNEKFWDSERAALTPTVDFKFITDAATATTAMQTGEINGSYGFPVASIPQLSKSNGTIAYGTSLDLTTMMFVHIDEGPLADPRLREALSLAVDYDGIRKGIYGNAATELRTLTPRAAWGYSENIFEQAWDALPAAKTDIERAKELVAEAGAPTEPSVLAYPASIAEATQLATAIKDAGAQVGIEIELNGQNDAEYLSLYFDDAARVGTQLMLWQGYLDFKEPVAYYQVYTSESIFNASGFNDPEFDRLVKLSRTQTDDDERATTITEAQRLYSEGLNIIPLASQYIRLYQSEGVTGASPTQAFLYRPWAAEVGKAGA